MIKILKYIAIIIVCATVIVIIAQLRCNDTNRKVSILVPADSNFAPIQHNTYRPPSLPFSKKSSGVKLPAGVTDKDVKKVITVTVRNVPLPAIGLEGKKTLSSIDIIETHRGEVFIHKDSSIASVTITTFEAPVVAFQTKFGIGVTVGAGEKQIRFSPLIVFVPVEWFGWVHAPVLGADFDGIGFGAQLNVYHDLSAGALRLWRYEGGAKIKLTVSYVF